MKRIIAFLSIICMSAHCLHGEWVEQELTGDDAPLNESYSYSPEIEESALYDFFQSLREIRPDKFSGEVTFKTRHNELYDDSYDTADYWYERYIGRMNWQTKKVEIGALALRRFGEPGVSQDTYFKYQVKKLWAELNSFCCSDKIMLGNYRAQYGQGLVFYGSVIEFSRPIMAASSGLRVERGSNPNAYLNGFGWENTWDRLSCSLFVSRAWLSADLNPDGSVNEDLYGLKDDYGLLETETQRDCWRRFYEDLVGWHSSFHVIEGMQIGVTGYEAYYNKTVNPSNITERYSHVFRGNRNTVMGVDWKFEKKEVNISGEYAQSKSRGENTIPREGSAWTMTPMIKMRPWEFFITAYDYSAGFFNRHAKGPSFNNADPNNQKGFVYGIRYNRKPHTIFATYRTAQSEQSEWTGSAQSTSPRFPADMQEVYAEYAVQLTKAVEAAARVWNDIRDRYLDIDPTAAAVLSQTQQERKRSRGRITWTPSQKIRYQVRYENRVEKIPVTGERLSGDLIFGDIVYKPIQSLSINFRQTVFDSGETYISQYEPVWYGIYQSQNFFSQEGMRNFIVVQYKPTKHLSIWTRYGRTELTDGSINDDFRLQADIYF